MALQDIAQFLSAQGCEVSVEQETASTSGLSDYPALNVEAIGAYAVKIDWSDGHKTGIYSFDYLRKICQCDACKDPVSVS